MQPMARFAQYLHRYSLDLSPRVDAKGSVPPRYIMQPEEYRCYVYPTQDGIVKGPNGITYQAGALIIINDSADFVLGDRLGTADKILYEVTSIYTLEGPTRQQQLGVKVL